MMDATVTIQLPTTAVEWVALVGGVLGAVLGLRAEIRAWKANRPQLKVIPLVGFAAPGHGVPPVMLGVEVINIGTMVVTVDQVGFCLREGDTRCAILTPISTKSITMPYRLEPHTSQTFFADPRLLPAGMIPDTKHAYAQTATDALFTGTSEALKKVVAAGRLPRTSPVMLPKGGLSTSRSLAGWDPNAD